jgi:c-di-GMP-binding flagellar brake protein YcgR
MKKWMKRVRKMLKIGTPISLETKIRDEFVRLRCKVVELKDDQVFIDYPINEKTGKTTYLIEGTHLEALFLSDDHNVYMFETKVLGRKLDIIPMVILSYPGNEKIYRIQRRQFVRVETPVDVAVQLEPGKTSFVSVTSDISAGGAAIILPNGYEFTLDTKLFTWFVFPMQSGEYHYLNLQAKVVRQVKEKNGQNIVSIQFNNISEKERQIIFRFIFERQLEMKKKESVLDE